jgi:hypothetical protein
VTFSRGLPSPSNRATASGLVASPHSARCVPHTHRSIGQVWTSSGAAVVTPSEWQVLISFVNAQSARTLKNHQHEKQQRVGSGW